MAQGRRGKQTTSDTNPEFVLVWVYVLLAANQPIEVRENGSQGTARIESLFQFAYHTMLDSVA